MGLQIRSGLTLPILNIQGFVKSLIEVHIFAKFHPQMVHRLFLFCSVVQAWRNIYLYGDSWNSPKASKEIIRLDTMAYLDSDSNPGSKPKRLSDKNYKNCALKQSNKFWHFIQPLTKHSIYKKKKYLVCFQVEIAVLLAPWLYPTQQSLQCTRFFQNESCTFVFGKIRPSGQDRQFL